MVEAQSRRGGCSRRQGRTRPGKPALDPRFLDASNFSNMEIRRHNIVTDPLPDAAFDLIHARLVLIHIPEREQVLARLVPSPSNREAGSSRKNLILNLFMVALCRSRKKFT